MVAAGPEIREICDCPRGWYQSADMAQYVLVEEDPMPGREVPLTPGITLGRAGTDVLIADPDVSRRHAAVRDQGGSPAIEDLDSLNGTYVNDHRISSPMPLRPGDMVRIGHTKFRVQLRG
jgi:pSer/pThr/pTyr-binding forkhead associated (FHA) protein